ncbi:hypothetical protein BLNAU_14365 [Blattamonas nauphoetae]|uniref:Uncharacterized protein n=1 Tax=Blattamonas nauphoetae TaxID=2049346 RepID=A0ABQ9XIR6_9EUKA|nr:hypothetical protein BLNAU_14365 [Blattamonas nauphoetae]
MPNFNLRTEPMPELSLGVSRCALRMETSLIRSTLVNMASSTPLSPGKQLFGSAVGQRVVGSCVRKSTNHDSGTGMMSPNLGGNLLCLNTSFSSCIRQPNEAKHFSFENRTQGFRLSNVYVTVPSVSFTLCTSNELTFAVCEYETGGAAIFVMDTSASVTIPTCFFHKCTCTAPGNDGELCSSCAGMICIPSPSLTLLSLSVLPRIVQEADRDGAIVIRSLVVRISNSAFVDCSSKSQAGAVFSYIIMDTLLSFIQFRGCSSADDPDARDIFIARNSSSQISTDIIQFCDSTSGAPNVFFLSDSASNSDLVPQISFTPTIKSVDVSFDGDEATVTVETEEAIRGTMGLLLDGSNVPRLVHVVFGDRKTLSPVGKVFVSSGTNGVLPSASYSHRKSTLPPFPLPTVLSAESTLKDWKTTEIVVKGVRLEEGSYWMLVEKEGKKWNITLTRSDSMTLIGRAPLYPSTAEGRLEWETEYEVTKVMCLPEGEQHEEQVELQGSVTFITPAELPRIEACTRRHLNKEQTNMIVLLEGRALLSRTGKVSVTNGTMMWESLSVVIVVDDTHCTAEFAVGEVETSHQLRFGEEYTLRGSWTESNGFHVEDGITLVVPFPPIIAHIEFVFSNTLHTTCFVKLTGTDLMVGNSLKITLNDSLSFIATITSETEARSTELLIGWPTTLRHNTQYTLTSIEAMNEDYGIPSFDHLISNSTGSLPDDVVIFVDRGSSSESTLFSKTNECSSTQ